MKAPVRMCGIASVVSDVGKLGMDGHDSGRKVLIGMVHLSGERSVVGWLGMRHKPRVA